MNGLPVWVKAVATVGIPAAIAFFLLAMMAGMVSSPITETLALMKRHEASGDTQARLLRAICRQGAKTDFALAECER